MAKYPLKAKTREGTGKGSARKLRAEGLVPAVLYGEGENQLLTVEERQLEALFRTAGRASHLVDLEVEGDSGARCLALLREIQGHPFKDNVLHVDLQRVSRKKKIHLTVPVVLTGEPVGVKTEGGVLELLARELEIQCLPDQMPDEIQIDVSELAIGDSIHVSDIQVEGVAILTPESAPVAMVARPTKVEEVKPAVEGVEAGVVEGEEAEEEKPGEKAPAGKADQEEPAGAKE